jgi:hypothetical protein
VNLRDRAFGRAITTAGLVELAVMLLATASPRTGALVLAGGWAVTAVTLGAGASVNRRPLRSLVSWSRVISVSVAIAASILPSRRAERISHPAIPPRAPETNTTAPTMTAAQDAVTPAPPCQLVPMIPSTTQDCPTAVNPKHST